MNRFPGVTIEFSDHGLVELTQQHGLSDPDFVELHPLHIRHIAQHLGLMRADPDLQAIDTMRRQMLTLRDRIAELDDLLQSVPSFPPTSRMTEDCVLSSELLTLVDEYIAALDPVAAEGHSVPIVESDSMHRRPAAQPAKRNPITPAAGQLSLEV